MDFQIVFNTATILCAIVLAASQIVYFYRVKGIYSEVGANTKRALVLFGLASIFLALAVITLGIIPAMVRMWWILFFIFITNTQANALFRDRRRIVWTAILTVVFSVAIMISQAVNFYEDLMLSVGLSIFIVASLILAVYGVHKSPSPFTGSILVISSLAAIATIGVQSGLITTEPQYFLVIVLPLAVEAGVLFSIMRPWRYIVISTLGLLTAVSSASMILASLISNEWIIYSYVAVAGFAAACALAPLSFFMREAQSTGARTPLYISLVLVGLILLIVTHANAWGIAHNPPFIWDRYILFIDWILGLVVVGSFLQAGVSAVFTSRARLFVREFLLVFLTGMGMLGNRRLFVEGLELDMLYIPLALFIVVGIGLLLSVAYRVNRAGNRTAAIRFGLFTFASVFVGVIAMFSDIFEQAGLYPLVIVFLLLSGFMLLGSGPAVAQVLQRKNE